MAGRRRAPRQKAPHFTIKRPRGGALAKPRTARPTRPPRLGHGRIFRFAGTFDGPNICLQLCSVRVASLIWGDASFCRWFREMISSKEDYEYYMNCKRSPLHRAYLLTLLARFYWMSQKLGFTISPNTIGPGLCIAHRGNILISPYAEIGENFRIHAGTSI